MPELHLDHLDAVAHLIAQCRRHIVSARIALASDMAPWQSDELWRLVDRLEHLLQTLSPDFEAELEQIDRDIEAALRR